MRSTGMPVVANRIGNSPQDSPKLRLLTSPAWLAEDSAGSVKLVRRKICRLVSGGVGVVVVVVGGFQLGVAAGFADEHRAQAEGDQRIGQAEQERCGAQSVVGGEVAGQQRGERDRAVAGGFVETHGQAALAGSDEVDLHDDGGRPGQALIDAQQHVGRDHPSP